MGQGKVGEFYYTEHIANFFLNVISFQEKHSLRFLIQKKEQRDSGDILRAVNVGADSVADIDTAFGRELGCLSNVNTLKRSGC